MSSRHAQCEFLDGVYTSVMRRIFKPGFHKDLSTEIELMLTKTLLPDRCRIVVEETVPKGMYVDLDQLRDWSEFTGLRTFSAASVDVEKPEFESEAFRLYIFSELRPQENLRLASVEIPVHLRYHRPRMPTPEERRRGQSPTAVVRLRYQRHGEAQRNLSRSMKCFLHCVNLLITSLNIRARLCLHHQTSRKCWGGGGRPLVKANKAAQPNH